METLARLAEAWEGHDVIVVNLPVASGKSAIAMAIASWARAAKQRQSCIITPTKLLVDQYLEDYPKCPVLKSREDYTCDLHSADEESPPSCGQVKDKLLGRYCSGCKYTKALRTARAVPYVLANNWTYYAHKLHRSCLIADEAHNLIGMIKELHSYKLWWRDYHFPNYVTNYKQIYSWVERHDARDRDPKLKKLWADMNSGRPRYVLDITWEPFGRSRELQKVLRMVPVDVRDLNSEEKHPLWPDKTKKIILLSATLSMKDVEQLGLGHKRVAFVEATSPIPAERRPVVLNYVGALSYANREQMVPLMAQRLRELAALNEGRGLVHVTYSLLPLLQAELGDEARFIWHGKEDKMEQFAAFRASKNGILIACGLQEGIDLPYDEARWQVICKVPWPSLAEPAVKHMAEQDEEWYAWETARQVLQAAGRVCRTPTDFGTTYILDSSFERLYKNYGHLFPNWWKDAVRRQG